jgi:predicted RNA-binding protein with TRAM domain
MPNRNFDSRYVIQRLMDRVNAQNLYGFQKYGQPIINNPQNSDPASYRIASYNSGAQTTVDRGLLGGYSVSLGGIANLIADVPTVTQPGAPTNLVATPGDTTVDIAFTPGDDGGGTITNYEYSLDGGITFVAFSPAQIISPLTISGLTNGTTYTIKIKAVNSAGPGQASASVTATPVGVPPDPTIDEIVSGNQSLSVYYTQGSDGGLTITNYFYSTDGGTTYVLFNPEDTTEPLTITETSDTNTTLENGTTYNVRIKAVNAAGTSGASNQLSGTPDSFSPPAINLSVAGDTIAYIYFTAGNNGSGTSITKYQYTLDGTSFTDIIDTNNPLMIDSLINNTAYTIRIRAVNNLSENSALSNSTTVTPVVAVTPATATLIYDPNSSSSYSGTGTTVFNIGSGGTVTGTQIDVSWVNGAAGASGRKVFDFADGDRITFGNFNFGTSMTVIAWVYPRSGGDYFGNINSLLTNTTSGNTPSGFKFGWNWWDPGNPPSRAIFMEAGNDTDGGSTASIANIVQYDQWQHLAYVFDRTNEKAVFYWNGQPVTMPSISTVSNIGMNNEEFSIGTFVDGSYWMNAQLGIINVYVNNLLNAAQIELDYNNTKANYGL